MTETQQNESIKKAKNIAAVVYLLAMIVITGGSYFHQQSKETATSVSARQHQESQMRLE